LQAWCNLAASCGEGGWDPGQAAPDDGGVPRMAEPALRSAAGASAALNPAQAAPILR
jgi:hypothetical protein